MLVPVRQLYPIRLGTTETRTITLEENLPVMPILQPKLFFRNISSTDQFVVTIRHILNLGVSDDPLLTGTYSTQLVTIPVAPSSLAWHVFPSVFLSNEQVYHEVVLQTSAATAEVVVQMWVEGMFEESLKVLPEYEPILI